VEPIVNPGIAAVAFAAGAVDTGAGTGAEVESEPLSAVASAGRENLGTLLRLQCRIVDQRRPPLLLLGLHCGKFSVLDSKLENGQLRKTYFLDMISEGGDIFEGGGERTFS
jgi:hypothetical protein